VWKPAWDAALVTLPKVNSDLKLDLLPGLPDRGLLETSGLAARLNGLLDEELP
jgi:hypothetical protein